MNASAPTIPVSARWLHRWAILTACVTLPLLFLGAEVTTKKVGLVDLAWPTSPVALFQISWVDASIGYLIEHSHRLAGYTVGTCVIILVALLWRWEPRNWVRYLGLVALGGVITQGILGGMRVRLHAILGDDLALIHGCFGQMVFAVLVSLALCTSRRWRLEADEAETGEQSKTLKRCSLAITALLVGQLILGAMVRHKSWPLAQRGHILTAFAVVAAVCWLAAVIRKLHGSERHLVGAIHIFAVLLVAQLLLGVEAWMVRFSGQEMVNPGHWLFNRDLVRSAHVLVGSLLLATSVAVTLEAHRRMVLTYGHLKNSEPLGQALLAGRSDQNAVHAGGAV